MEEKKYYKKRLLAIAIPLMLSNLVSQLQLMIDKIFLGRLDISRMSAVGNASAPLWTTISMMFSLSVGAAIIVSQAIGSEDRERAKETISSLFKYNNIIAILLFLFWLFCSKALFTLMGVSDEIMDMTVSYAKIYSPAFLIMGIGNGIITTLQVSEMTGIMVVYGLVRSGTNIVLDAILIFGKLGLPRMEVAGASLATLIAELTGGIVLLIYVVCNKKIWLKPRLKDIIKAKPAPYISSVKMGIPSACEDVAWNGGNLFLIAMLNHVSMEAAGIYSIIFGVQCIPVAIIGALSNATLTLAGQETGKGHAYEIMRIVRIALSWVFVMVFFVLIMFYLFPDTIIGWFTTDKAVILASATYLMIVGVDLFPKSMNMIIGSGIKGYGATKWMLGTQIFGTCFIVICSAVMVLVLHMGMTALFCLVVADETIRCTINYIKLRHICNKTK